MEKLKMKKIKLVYKYILLIQYKYIVLNRINS